VLPLGTGNDMARTLGWGRGYNGEDMNGILRDLIKAETIWLDRWAVSITPLSSTEKKEKEDEGKQGDGVKHSISNNYFSIGVDAKVALDFHLARQASPDSFKSRKMNKIKYFGYGTSAVFDGTCKGNSCAGGLLFLERNEMTLPITDLSSKLSLQVDDKEIELPKGLEGLIVLNLPSYAGGSDLWGKTDGVYILNPKVNMDGFTFFLFF
jgi:diacylglycerol kinase (ATP)